MNRTEGLGTPSWLRRGALFLIVALLLAACGGAEEETAEVPDVPEATEQPEPTDEGTETAMETAEETETSDETATADTDETVAAADLPQGDYVVALSNSFLGNTWRQTMVEVFEHTAQQAQEAGLISDYRVENTSQNTATEQIAQIQSLILEEVDALLIVSASPTALNPVIEQACDAGIVVVVFDSLASAECEYDVQDDIYRYGYEEAEAVAEAMGGEGNVLMVRGVVGSEPEEIIHQGQLDALAEYPEIEIVEEVVGQASTSITQEVVQGVLPSLPEIDGVISGGSSFGAVQAFEAAGRALPIVAFDNTGEALRYWQQQIEETDYQGVSIRTEPGQAAAAFWVALKLLNGQEVPELITLPNLLIEERQLEEWIEVTPEGNVAAWLWSLEQTNRAIEANMAGEIPEPPPVPDTAP